MTPLGRDRGTPFVGFVDSVQPRSPAARNAALASSRQWGWRGAIPKTSGVSVV